MARNQNEAANKKKPSIVTNPNLVDRFQLIPIVQNFHTIAYKRNHKIYKSFC